jgi:acyl dehydratase
MSSTRPSSFIVSLEDSLLFARLSGDFNPLHVNPITARRLSFGSTVVHGIHLVLATFDRMVAALDLADNSLEELSVVFHSAVLTDNEVLVALDLKSTDQIVSVVGSHGGRRVFSIRARFGKNLITPGGVKPRNAGFDESKPTELLQVGTLLSGILDVQLQRDLFTTLFPNLDSTLIEALAADLLASTRLVGMQYPGLHSVYAGFAFKKSSQPKTTFNYRVTSFDVRFRLARISVAGVYFDGHIDTIFRHPPVAQPSLRDIMRGTIGDPYKNDRVLIVGGSRGLGELAAKCVLAGGGSVVVSYASGQDDALRVCAEAAEHGRSCWAVKIDVLNMATNPLPPEFASGFFTHVYYFASPRIVKTSSRQWEPSTFQLYSRVYVDAFASLLQHLTAGGSELKAAFYPSTVYIETNEKGFAEYVTAKAAGEQLCRQLASQYGVTIHCPRLPRMLTDQTSGITDGADALTVIKAEVDRLHAPK